MSAVPDTLAALGFSLLFSLGMLIFFLLEFCYVEPVWKSPGNRKPSARSDLTHLCLSIMGSCSACTGHTSVPSNIDPCIQLFVILMCNCYFLYIIHFLSSHRERINLIHLPPLGWSRESQYLVALSFSTVSLKLFICLSYENGIVSFNYGIPFF